MLLAQNLPSYFIPSDVIAVDTPVIMRQTMKISRPLIFTNYLFKMGLWNLLKPRPGSFGWRGPEHSQWLLRDSILLVNPKNCGL